MVDLDSNPTKLLEVVEVGKQLLMTRGCLTTFSIANDVAKYFAILPAMFMVAFPEIAPLNVMGLTSPESAILSAVIFNALIIVALIPLALRGVRYRPLGAAALLRRSLLDLRRRRRRRAVRRHQAHRRRAEPRRARLRRTSMKKELVVALRMTLATLVLTGLVYPLVVTGVAQVALPVARERQRRLGRGARRGLGADRPGLQEPGLLPVAALGGGSGRLRRRELRRARTSGPRRRSCATAWRPTSRGCGRRTRRRRPRCRSSSSRPPRAASTRTSARRRPAGRSPRVAAARGVAVARRRGAVDRAHRAAHVRASWASRASTSCC